MGVPDYQTYMTPILHLLSDGKQRHTSEISKSMVDYFQLTELETQEILPSGTQTKHHNRVGWAISYMKQAGLVKSVRRGVYEITEVGMHVVLSGDEVNSAYLSRFEEFQAFKLRRKSTDTNTGSVEMDTGRTPDEVLDDSFATLRNTLAVELLERLKNAYPQFFEQAVIDLLLAMGYGGSLPEAAERVGKSGDGGIDGIINEDRLGLDVVYIQAKRWQGPVGARDVRDFAGSLEEKKASKGIFITTSDFTREAKDFVSRIGKRIVLINGDRLAELMIDFNVGVTSRKTYIVKRIDEEYFVED